MLSRVVLTMRCFRIAAVQERRIGMSDQESFLRVSFRTCFSHGSKERCKSHFSVTMTEFTPTVVAVHCCMGRHQSQVGRTLNNADIESLKPDILEYSCLGEMLPASNKACKLCVYHKKFHAQVLGRDLLYQIFVISILPSVQPGIVALPGNSEFHKFLLLLIFSLTLPNSSIQNKTILRYTNFFVNLHLI